MKDKIAALAADMGVSRAEAQGFVDCLRVWTSKGYTIEGAIQKNLETLSTLLTNVSEGFSAEYGPRREGAVALRRLASDLVWDAVNGGAA